jgi:homoserine O-acetyltransferase
MSTKGTTDRPTMRGCQRRNRWHGQLVGAVLLALPACAQTPNDGAAGGAAARTAVLLDPADSLWSAPAPDRFDVRIATTKGTFTITVQREWAPLGADRFFNLVRAGFYDDSRFFRVRAGFIAQFGLPGDPRVAPHWIRNAITDDPVATSNVRGAVAYAMTGPDTRTTQVYINLADNARLDEQGFAPFGLVTQGMDVVDRLYAGYDESAGGGVRAGKQDRIIAEGNAHLDRDFPLLDRLISARIVP